MTKDDERQVQIETLLQQAVLARLATADPATCQPHVVPVWFLWDGQAVWISAFDSTRKVKELQRNPRCAVLVEPKEPDDSLQAVLFEGPAELIKDPDLVAEMSLRIYTRYMGEQGVLAKAPQSWLRDPENTLVRLQPEKVRAW